MGGLPDDVVKFVEQRFAQENRQTVYAVLDMAAVGTPRVMRAVLYLSKGSLSRLKHYVEECAADVRGILTSAEYENGAAEIPLLVRDMSVPFTDEANLGTGTLKNSLAVVRPRIASAGPQRADSNKGRNYHSYLAHRSFKLGKVTYLIASAQPQRNHVSCYRKSATVVRRVTLPLLFVLEQLAERIELEATHL